MASAAFRSKGRRSSTGSPADAGCLRRSRSLSRCSGRFPPPSPEIDEYETPRGRFVNKLRGSEFDISLDDLADEFFQAVAQECEEDAAPAAGRSSRRVIGERLMADTESSRRRGRSVSRHRADSAASKGKGFSGNNGNSRPRRSASVSRSRVSELEVDKTGKFRPLSKKGVNSTGGGLQKPSLHKQTSEDHALGTSMSQKDFFQSQDCCSSHSSSLTDDETQDARSSVSVNEKTIQEVYYLGKTDHPAGDGGFRSYENKCKERNLVEELRELEKSEKRKQDLLAALAIEEKRGQELYKIVKELLSSPKKIAEPTKQSPSTKKRTDKLKISKYLDEEAERYFEDFLSNVEDTDLSSFEGERSDTGSTTKPSDAINNDEAGIHPDLLRAASSPVVTDGVMFPWLQWETSNSSSPSPCKSKTAIKQNSDSASGSWSPEIHEGFCAISGEVANVSRLGAAESQRNKPVVPERGYSFDMDEYLQLQRREDLLLEVWEQRQRIASGSLVLCSRAFI
ncbi:uncharacterized protein LOC110026651 isoform X1 [Phalaenopsis equestris]|uniref:uncharacterized protein LOC110026651 isoform X1 n=1 Tax=Phalaenopsis equestris TaxID=78828 RepID=UPI0009E45413|nr:uncharacterized protein LOC110026651 isoform X1 [Phalaenopsis equestris]